MVEPVVVMPEMDSNKASVKLSPRSENRNGNAPNIPDNTQAEFVSRKASLSPKFSSCLVLLVNQRDIPTKQEIRAADANPNQFWDPDEKSTSIGMSMVKDKIVRRTPSIENTGSRFISVLSLSEANYMPKIYLVAM
tara:strand:- start:594 stop:1001 length:408 start_codon:yes stop_codon:yes gene_type:complete